MKEKNKQKQKQKQTNKKPGKLRWQTLLETK